jgi:hypothetical protein
MDVVVGEEGGAGAGTSHGSQGKAVLGGVAANLDRLEQSRMALYR